MPRKCAPGVYDIGRKDYDDDYGIGRKATHSTLIVAKGEAINDADSGAFGRVFGLTASKWYVCKRYMVTAKERMPNGRFATSGSVSHDTADFYQREFDTKKEAVEFVRNRVSLDEEY